MPTTMTPVVDRARDERLHLRPATAKASLEPVNRVHQDRAQWLPLARVMRRAIVISGLSDKEAAASAGTSPQHLAMMLGGDKRPQAERFYASDLLRGPLLIALAEQNPDRFDVVTTITVRRSA